MVKFEEIYRSFLESLGNVEFSEKEKGIIGLTMFFPNKEISDMLGISPNTCRYHLKNIYKKTELDRHDIRKKYCLFLTQVINTGNGYKRPSEKGRSTFKKSSFTKLSRDIEDYLIGVFKKG